MALNTVIISTATVTGASIVVTGTVNGTSVTVTLSAKELAALPDDPTRQAVVAKAMIAAALPVFNPANLMGTLSL